MGILSIIEEECGALKSTEAGLQEKLFKTCLSKQTATLKSKQSKEKSQFDLCHYAGTVCTCLKLNLFDTIIVKILLDNLHIDRMSWKVQRPG